MPADITPILVRSRQYVVRAIISAKEALPSVKLTDEAVRSNTENDSLVSHLDTMTALHLFMDPAKPQRAIDGSEGEQSPQRSVSELAELIHAEERKAMLICGA